MAFWSLPWSSLALSAPTLFIWVKVDDIIVAINGAPVQEIADLTCYLGEHASPGDADVITLIRDGARIALPLIVGKR